MKIVSIETILLDIPLPKPQVRAFGTFDTVNSVLIRLKTDEGLEGLGEVAVCGGPTWSQDFGEGIKLVIDRYLSPGLVGQDPTKITALLEWMELVVKGNRFAKAAIEFALFDVVGKALDVPVYALLGGAVRDRLPVSWLLNIDPPQAAVDEAEAWLEKGIKYFKLKVGNRLLADDLDAVQTIVKAVGDRATLRVDANQGWDEATAIEGAKRLAAMGIQLLEQPIPAWNIDGLARVRQASTLPIMIDESLHSQYDALTLIKREAADIFCLKLAKSGGILNTKKITAIAEAAGIPCYLSMMIEASVGSAAALHFAAAERALPYGCETIGPLFLADDITQDPIRYEMGQALVPDGPGLGVRLDEDKVNHYSRNH